MPGELVGYQSLFRLRAVVIMNDDYWLLKSYSNLIDLLISQVLNERFAQLLLSPDLVSCADRRFTIPI